MDNEFWPSRRERKDQSDEEGKKPVFGKCQQECGYHEQERRNKHKPSFQCERPVINEVIKDDKYCSSKKKGKGLVCSKKGWDSQKRSLRGYFKHQRKVFFVNRADTQQSRCFKEHLLSDPDEGRNTGENYNAF